MRDLYYGLQVGIIPHRNAQRVNIAIKQTTERMSARIVDGKAIEIWWER